MASGPPRRATSIAARETEPTPQSRHPRDGHRIGTGGSDRASLSASTAANAFLSSARWVSVTWLHGLGEQRPSVVNRNGLRHRSPWLGGLGITYSDDDLMQFVLNIYAVLLTRGMLGTYVYVCDPGLRGYLSNFLCT